MMNDSFEKKRSGDVSFLVSKKLSDHKNIRHAFSTREGGVSDGYFGTMNLGFSSGDDESKIRENYNRFFAAIDIPLDDIVVPCQVHRNDVEEATTSDRGNGYFKKNRFQSADSLMTNEKGVALICYYADCVPVLLYDPKNHAIATVHSGWKGTGLKIVKKAVLKMVERYGSNPADILAAIGPAIYGCCYEVSKDVFENICDSFSNSSDFFSQKREGKFLFDLPGAVKCSLKESGVRLENICESGICTACEKDSYFSHRASGGNRGIMGAVIELV